MTPPARTPGRTALYRLFDAQRQLLYVGIGFDPTTRWRAHAKEKPWWQLVAEKEVAWYATRDEAECAEERAILVERPAFNVLQHRQRYRAFGGSGRLLPHVEAAGDAYRQAVARQEAATEYLAATVRAAHRDRMKQSAILRATSHVWSREYLRVILGLTKKRGGDTE